MAELAVSVGPPAYGASMDELSLGRATGDIDIDCNRCLARPTACGDCIVSVLLGPVGAVGESERTAFAVLADSGLVPPLRLVTDAEGVA